MQISGLSFNRKENLYMNFENLYLLKNPYYCMYVVQLFLKFIQCHLRRNIFTIWYTFLMIETVKRLTWKSSVYLFLWYIQFIYVQIGFCLCNCHRNFFLSDYWYSEESWTKPNIFCLFECYYIAIHIVCLQ